jgi:hypothetical protein
VHDELPALVDLDARLIPLAKPGSVGDIIDAVMLNTEDEGNIADKELFTSARA